MFLLAWLAKIPLKDWIYIGIIVALIAGFTWYTFHERSVGRQQEIHQVEHTERQYTKKVAAINTHNKVIEARTNEQIKSLSVALANANHDLATRMQHNKGRTIILSKASSVTCQSPNNKTITTTTKAPTRTVATIGAHTLKDDLVIALNENLMLQSIINEFKQIRK
jgi:hypothetical protein